MAFTSPDVFSLHYEAAEHLLVGRWQATAHPEEDYPPFELLVEGATRHDHCRFWLLDMRERPWHAATFNQWFEELLAWQVVQVLGSPVFVACVAAERHRAAIENLTTQAMLRHKAQDEFYPYFFNNEQAAREWLVYQHSHPHRPPQR